MPYCAALLIYDVSWYHILVWRAARLCQRLWQDDQARSELPTAGPFRAHLFGQCLFVFDPVRALRLDAGIPASLDGGISGPGVDPELRETLRETRRSYNRRQLHAPTDSGPL